MDIGDEDIIEFWKQMYDAKVEFIMVGGFAVMLHGGTRLTQDVDVWIKDTKENRRRLKKVFTFYEYSDLIDFENIEFVPGWTTLYIAGGIELDIMTRLSGFEQARFDECYQLAPKAIISGIEIPFLHINHLLEEKRKVARPKDLLDVDELERIRQYRNNEK